MIEIIYKDSAKDGGTVIVKPPKNIRQIGSPRGRHKIYMEDYVYTFLHSAAFEGGKQKRAAVLLGKSEVSQDIRYTFISSAILCEDFIFREEGILFDESCWEYIYKEIKQYFDSQDIVGWFLGAAGFPLELSPAVEAAHRKYFAGRDKVLFLSEPSEGEDLFFAYEQGILQKKEGYYIYYEKNLPMQEYMVSIREQAREREGGIETRIYPNVPEGLEGESLKVPEQDAFFSGPGQEETGREHELIQDGEKEKTAIHEKEDEESEHQPETFFYSEKREEKNDGLGKMTADEAIRKYRSMLQGKKAPLPQKRMSPLLYMAAAAAMVILCVIGITTVNNYEKMQQVEQVLSVLSDDSDSKQKEDSQSSELVVESIPGEVTPQKGTDGQQSAPEDAQQPVPVQEDESQETGNQSASDENPGTPDEEGQSKETGNQPQGEENPEGETPKTQDESQGVKGQEGESQETQAAESQEGEAQGNQEGDAQESQESGSQEGDSTDSQEGSSEEETQETGAQAYLDQGYYIVQPGDKLELICKKIYNTTAMMDKLCEINGITDVDKIFAGQKLVLP